MATQDATICCPDCGAPLSLIRDRSDRDDDGVLVCLHAHIYDLADSDDDRRLRDIHGSGYKRLLLALGSADAYEQAGPLPPTCT